MVHFCFDSMSRSVSKTRGHRKYVYISSGVFRDRIPRPTSSGNASSWRVERGKKERRTLSRLSLTSANARGRSADQAEEITVLFERARRYLENEESRRDKKQVWKWMVRRFDSCPLRPFHRSSPIRWEKKNSSISICNFASPLEEILRRNLIFWKTLILLASELEHPLWRILGYNIDVIIAHWSNWNSI